MKFNLFKTGVVGGAVGVLLATSAYITTASAETTFYGRVAAEVIQTNNEPSDAAEKDGANSTGGLDLVNGSNRLGFRASKDVSGSMATSIAGNVEVDFGEGGSATPNLRQANVAATLSNGGVIRLGQQNTPKVSSGWYSNAFNYQASSLDVERFVNGSRYSGVSYTQPFAVGSVSVMVGFDAADDGDEQKTEDTSDDNAQNAIDNTSLLLSLNPMPGVSLGVNYDSSAGNLEDDPFDENAIAMAVGYSAGAVGAHLGYSMKTKSNRAPDDDNGDSVRDADAERVETAVSLNGSYNIGVATLFAGVKTRSFDNTDEEGKDIELEDETSISVGANMSMFGGASFVGYDQTTNVGGVEGAETTRIMSGWAYSF